MKIEIKYSRHFDLLFHVLAYLKVDNASDCYSQEYIHKMTVEKSKQKFSYDIVPSINLLAEYYNSNFKTLGMINFLPFRSCSFEEMKDLAGGHYEL